LTGKNIKITLISVHKYQGSESPCIVIPIHTSLVGSKKAIATAVKNNEVQLRFTGLKGFIEDHFSKIKS